MARKKPKQVDEVTHRDLGVTVPLMMDPESLTFFAHYADQRVEGPDASKVKGDIYALIVASNAITWHPVITVQLPGEACTWCKRRGIEVAAERWYLGVTTAGEQLELAWSAYDRHTSLSRGKPNGTESDRLLFAHRLRHQPYGNPLTLPHTRRSDGHHGKHDAVTHRYTPELWAGIKRVQAMLAAAEEQLKTLFTTEDGVARVLTAGTRGAGLLLSAATGSPVGVDDAED